MARKRIGKHRATGRGLNWRRRVGGHPDWVHWVHICSDLRDEYARQVRYGASKREARDESLRLVRARVPWAQKVPVMDIIRRCMWQ